MKILASWAKKKKNGKKFFVHPANFFQFQDAKKLKNSVEFALDKNGGNFFFFFFLGGVGVPN